MFLPFSNVSENPSPSDQGDTREVEGEITDISKELVEPEPELGVVEVKERTPASVSCVAYDIHCRVPCCRLVLCRFGVSKDRVAGTFDLKRRLVGVVEGGCTLTLCLGEKGKHSKETPYLLIST